MTEREQIIEEVKQQMMQGMMAHFGKEKEKKLNIVNDKINFT